MKFNKYDFDDDWENDLKHYDDNTFLKGVALGMAFSLPIWVMLIAIIVSLI